MSHMRRHFTPATRYYIRKLLQQNLDRLIFPMLDRGIRADDTSNVREILTSLYVKESKVDSMILELERLALLHQSLNQASVKNQQDLQKTEAQIFGLLGCEIKASFLETLTIGFQFTHR
ncbi:hypothetical protein ACKFKF_10645 [Phormidesmis sp. 146-12]